jgi:CubicO group peptidase (beta-lactamase class C family)
MNPIVRVLPLLFAAVPFAFSAPSEVKQSHPKAAIASAVAPAEKGNTALPDARMIHIWLRDNNVPDVGIGLIQDGRVKAAKVFGQLREGVPAPDNTIFDVASLTKPVVAILTLRLVTQGKWDLDEPLSHYFVDPDLADDPRQTKLTTRLVLTHETGLPNWRGNEPSKKLSFSFQPGTDVKYSGEAFQYLRQALEHKFKMSLQDLSRSWVFEPFGMKDTRHFWDRSMDESRYAGRHDKDGKELDLEKWYEPHAANLLLSTVGDYSQFAANVINGAGISEKLYSEMVSPHAPAEKGAGSATKKGFGFCWLVVSGLSNGEYALVHSGKNPGDAAMVVLLPKSRRGIVVLTNGENGDQVYKKVIVESLDLGAEILERLDQK